VFKNQSALRTSKQYVSLCNDFVIAGFFCQLLLCIFSSKFIAIIGDLNEFPNFPKTQYAVSFYNEQQIEFLNKYFWLNTSFYACFIFLFCLTTVAYANKYGSQNLYLLNFEKLKTIRKLNCNLKIAAILVLFMGVFVFTRFILGDGIGRNDLFAARYISDAATYGFIHVIINYVVSTLFFYGGLLVYFGLYFQIAWKRSSVAS
jgi:hypothetical protein